MVAMPVTPPEVLPATLRRSAAKLDGKVALITGGTGGFGLAMTKAFIEEGARVVIIDLNKADGERIASESEGTVAFVQGDVGKRGAWEQALQTAVATFGGLDILVNNAGISRKSDAHEMDEATFDLMLNIHLKSIFLSTQVIFPHFLEKGDGRVINIGSTGATRPRPGFTWYNLTKGGVHVATKSLAVEYAPKIRVNCIVPAIGNTNMLQASFGGDPSEEQMEWVKSWIPMKRITQPSDVANAAVFLVSDEASFITGTLLDVDGGRGI